MASENLVQRGRRSFKTKTGIILKVEAKWHVELSETLHAYLKESNGIVKFNIRKFRLKSPEPDCEYYYPTAEGLSLTDQQTLDLMLEMYQLTDVLEREHYLKVTLFTTMYILFFFFLLL